MRLGQTFDPRILPSPSFGIRLISPITYKSHPSLMIRMLAIEMARRAGGGVDPRLIFVLRVYNQGVQEQ